MTKDDVLFGYRLQLFDLAARTTVSQACRTFGVHRSTYYRWRAQVERSGLEMLRPRERRRPQMPNQLSPLVEQRIVAFCLGHPGLGPRRVAARLARPEWGGLRVSPNGVWRCLVRHGLNPDPPRRCFPSDLSSTMEGVDASAAIAATSGLLGALIGAVSACSFTAANKAGPGVTNSRRH
jgi:transposase